MNKKSAENLVGSEKSRTFAGALCTFDKITYNN